MGFREATCILLFAQSDRSLIEQNPEWKRILRSKIIKYMLLP